VAVVEILDDDVPPPGCDQWASPPASAPEALAPVATGDTGATLGGPADDAGASSLRAGPAARQERENAGASPAHFVEAQEEQGYGRSSVITAPHSTGR
jgi:hypothetical protein